MAERLLFFSEAPASPSPSKLGNCGSENTFCNCGRFVAGGAAGFFGCTAAHKLVMWVRYQTKYRKQAVRGMNDLPMPPVRVSDCGEVAPLTSFRSEPGPPLTAVALKTTELPKTFS